MSEFSPVTESQIIQEFKRMGFTLVDDEPILVFNYRLSADLLDMRVTVTQNSDTSKVDFAYTYIAAPDAKSLFRDPRNVSTMFTKVITQPIGETRRTVRKLANIGAELRDAINEQRFVNEVFDRMIKNYQGEDAVVRDRKGLAPSHSDFFISDKAGETSIGRAFYVTAKGPVAYFSGLFNGREWSGTARLTDLEYVENFIKRNLAVNGKTAMKNTRIAKISDKNTLDSLLAKELAEVGALVDENYDIPDRMLRDVQIAAEAFDQGLLKVLTWWSTNYDLAFNYRTPSPLAGKGLRIGRQPKIIAAAILEIYPEIFSIGLYKSLVKNRTGLLNPNNVRLLQKLFLDLKTADVAIDALDKQIRKALTTLADVLESKINTIKEDTEEVLYDPNEDFTAMGGNEDDDDDDFDGGWPDEEDENGRMRHEDGFIRSANLSFGNVPDKSSADEFAIEAGHYFKQLFRNGSAKFKFSHLNGGYYVEMELNALPKSARFSYDRSEDLFATTMLLGPFDFHGIQVEPLKFIVDRNSVPKYVSDHLWAPQGGDVQEMTSNFKRAMNRLQVFIGDQLKSHPQRSASARRKG
jgi:hypothetical protein